MLRDEGDRSALGGEAFDDRAQLGAEVVVGGGETLVRLPTASPESTTRAPIAPRIFFASSWAQTPPNIPVLALTTATGLLRNTQVMSSGREAQSSAFFSCPGTEWLYSGVEMRTASAERTASRNSATVAGSSSSASASNGGMSRSPSQSSSSIPSGAEREASAEQLAVQRAAPKASGDSEDLH